MLKVISKILCFIFPQKLFYYLEILITLIQGKGYGDTSIFEECRSCRKLLKNVDVKYIIDVGANVGEYTQELLKYYKQAKFLLLEPNLLNYKNLKTKFKKYKNIKIMKLALSNKNKKGYLYSDRSGSSLASLNKRNLSDFNINFTIKEKINIMKFETLINIIKKKTVIDYFKIDAEGEELKILQGIGKYICKIRLIQFEFGSCNVDSRTFFQDFWSYFKKNNFKIFRITSIGLIKIDKYSYIDEHFRTTNYIAVNKSL